MSFKIFTQSASMTALVASIIACNSSDDHSNAGKTTPDGGGGTSSGGSSTGGGSGQGTGGSGTGGASSDGATEGSTSCGDVAVLGDFWASTPAECTACMASNCYSELSACSSDTACSTYRDCLAQCPRSDSACQAACLPDAGAPATSSAIGACRADNCEACMDLTCAGTAWPAPSTAHQITMNATVVNFSTREPVAGVSVKVCAHTDTTCATPLDSATTASDGTVTLMLPAAPGGTDADILQSGPGIQTEITYPHALGGDSAYANITLQVLDTATAAAFQTLAGGAPFPDGGVPDGSAPDGGAGLGALSVLPRSCKNSVLAGATVTSSNAGSSASTSYLAKGIPSATATATDSTGIVAIVDHAVGTTTVTVKLGTTTLGTADVIVPPGVLTTITLPPN